MSLSPGSQEKRRFAFCFLCSRIMGTGSSIIEDPNTTATLEQARKAKQIDQQIEQDRRKIVLKLLLLGPGNSGKSTTLKQLRIIHDTGFSEAERLLQKGTIYGNLLSSVVELVEVFDKRSIDISSLAMEQYETVKRYMESNKTKSIDVLPENIGTAIALILKEPHVQDVMQNNTPIEICDSALYFFGRFEQIRESDYIPSTDDVLRIRTPTMGVVQYSIIINKYTFRVFDVGGQKAQRRKWIHLFDNVNAVLFITSLSDYNETLAEESTMNRMIDSINLFAEICNVQWFARTAMILFLNKIDLFAKKIKYIPITVALKNYRGKQEYKPSLDYIAKKYRQVNENPDRKIYIHETCATDTKQVEVVINLVVTMVIDQAMQQIGLQ